MLERSRAISQALANALVYPASVLVVACGTILFLLYFVVPRFEALLTSLSHEPPLAMRLLLAVSTAFRDYGLVAAVAAIAGMGLFAVWRRRAGARAAFDRRLLSLPILGDLLARIESERLAFLLGSLIASGVPVPAAMAATREAVANEAVRTALVEAEHGIERGDGLAAVLRIGGLLPDFALELVRIGEQTGDLAPMLIEASDILRREFEATTARMIGLVAPVSMVALGLLIGAIAFALFGAVMDVYDIAA